MPASTNPSTGDQSTLALRDDFRLRFSWRTKSEYAFFFLADRAGLYRGHGLEVSFLEGAGALRTIGEAVGDAQSVAVVPAGFAIAAIDGGVAARIVALYQRSANVVLLSRRHSAVRTPADLHGKTIAHVEGEVGTSFLEHICRLNGVDFNGINFTLTDSRGRIEKFRQGTVDVISVYRTNDLAALQQEFGDELCIFDPAAFGLAVPGMSLLAGADAMQEDGEPLSRFLAATDSAVRVMLRDPERVCTAYRDHVRDMEPGLLRLQVDETIRSLELRDSLPAGYVDDDVMRMAVNFLADSGKLHGSRDAGRFYTNRFFSPAG